MGKDSEVLLALKPVSFRYRKEIDPAGISQFGLVAEEVEKVNPDLIVRDEEGKPYSVRYDQVNAMLLNEFLKEHSTMQELRKEVAALTSRLKEQDLRMEKLSSRLEMSRSTPQMVANRR
jgi:Skp family chaperone for outer membrane proteins